MVPNERVDYSEGTILPVGGASHGFISGASKPALSGNIQTSTPGLVQTGRTSSTDTYRTPVGLCVFWRRSVGPRAVFVSPRFP